MKKLVFFLVICFLIVFPKGGFKIGDVPITWGFIIFFFLVPFGLIHIYKNRGLVFHLSMERKWALLLCLPFIGYSMVVLVFGTIETSFGFVVSYILNILLMPIILLFVYGRVIDQPDFRLYFNRNFPTAIRIVAIFGLLLFFQRIFTGELFEIPYLTVNGSDAGEVDMKNNLRGGNIMKLISTYNNGNIYGVCMLILMPLYMSLEKKSIFKLLFVLSLLLTLSRTVWVGLIVYGLIDLLKNWNTIRGFVLLTLIALIIFVGVPIVLELIEVDVGFLLDKKLGGRLHQLQSLDISIIGNGILTDILEIVYASIFKIFGLIGLIFFLLYLASPILISIISIWNSPSWYISKI